MEAAQGLWTIGSFFGSVGFAVICMLIILKNHLGIARVAAVIRANKEWMSSPNVFVGDLEDS